MEQDELFGGVEMAQNVASRGCFPRRKKHCGQMRRQGIGFPREIGWTTGSLAKTKTAGAALGKDGLWWGAGGRSELPTELQTVKGSSCQNIFTLSDIQSVPFK